MDKSDILLISDYGRSGQGWLSFMLCYILNARYIEPYDFLLGQEYSESEHVLKLTKGDLPNRDKSPYGLVVKTHGYPSQKFNLTDKIVYLTRDPRDIAVSAFFRFRKMRNSKKVTSWRQCIGWFLTRSRTFCLLYTIIKWKAHVDGWKNIDSHRVRYEDLLSDPKKVLKGILNHINVEAPDSLVDESVDNFSFKRITGRNPGEENLGTAEFRKGIARDYKNHFNKFQLALARAICASSAKTYDYNL